MSWKRNSPVGLRIYHEEDNLYNCSDYIFDQCNGSVASTTMDIAGSYAYRNPNRDCIAGTAWKKW